MMLKTEAICLRHRPAANTSRVVDWLTPDAGRLVTLIKGSQRPRSPFLGQYDTLYTCELVYYARNREGLHVARECAPLKMRSRLRDDWRAACAGAYLADLTAHAAPDGAQQPGLFDGLNAALDLLEADGFSAAFFIWYELRVLRELGWAPRLDACLSCGTAIDPSRDRPRFVPARGGLMCAACARARPDEGAPIAPAALALLAGMQRAQQPGAAYRTRLSDEQFARAAEPLGAFLRYHLDTPLLSRDVTLAALRARAV